MKIIPSMAAALGLTLALSIPAEAAGISISPLTKPLGVGDTVQFTIFADDILSDAPLLAGGLIVTFDRNLLNVTGGTLDPIWDPLSDQPIVIDNAIGTITNISFQKFFGPDIFGSAVALFRFTAKALDLGNSTVKVEVDTENPFVARTGDPLLLTQSSSIATISAVPLPAALPLFLIGLFSVRRRRAS